MFNFEGNSGSGETALSRHHGFETVGPIAVVFFVFLVLRVLFGAMDVPYAPFVALVGSLAFGAVWVVLKLRSNRRKMKQASALRAEVSALEEQEFALRFEEARLNGQLDRWDGSEAKELSKTDGVTGNNKADT